MTSSFRFLFTLISFATSAVAVPLWGQCGGIGYSGSTTCDSGSVCTYQNDYYSQCLPGSSTPKPTTTTPTTTTRPTTTTTSTGTGGTGLPAPSIPAGQLTQLTANVGSNPSGVRFYVYKPSSVKVNPGLLLALHPCGGTASQYFNSNQFRSLADQRGFIAIYGEAPASTHCWDVTSSAALKRDAGGDPTGLGSVIKYAISNWGVNPSKVFVTGTSSGAMMTNLMAASYPDLINAAAVFAGVPVGCLTNSAPTSPTDPCAAGTVIRSGSDWAARVRSVYSSYSGSYPRIQVWHGTSDPVVNYQSYTEQTKQWTSVFGISATPVSTSGNTPKSPWTKNTYGSGQLQTFSGQGIGHGIPDPGTESTALDFFGL
ncbi:hypothetical protein D9619_007137 [Psilocybe cf. subviscida]|uniref:Carboxylic ester hydrolase n=1 Tax=Psilocybe cf. subviscida TaxID=2480587 RepID=A0A8H5EX81_9AGAR|nr:hypothetical protein D9619_007137 [Psilocybe cf. subviscida]